jgi:filamentous hemagglutinin
VDDVNAPFIAKGWNPPYSGKFVREFTTGQETVFVRVHGTGNKARSWMMRADEVKGLTPAQIKDKFALPDLPTHISEVHVPAGTRIRAGKVAPQEGWGAGGSWQYELLERLPEELFKNTRPLR